MSELFDLDVSERVARHLLEENRDVPRLSHWNKVCREWRKAKAELIAALCPKTGRRSWKVIIEPAPHEKVSAFRSAASLVGIESAIPVMDFEIIREKIEEGGTMCADFGAKSGQKLTRAIVKWLVSMHKSSETSVLNDARLEREARGWTATGDEDGDLESIASSVVGRLVDAWKKHGNGTVVLSANILDILLASEYSSFSSCHGFDGCHRAGPQQYAADDVSLVAYLYKNSTPISLSGERYGVPKKLWRQMVYVDKKNKSAVFMRHYGCAVEENVHSLLRKETAELICRLCGIEIESEPHWFRKREGDGSENPITNTGSFAWPDDRWTSIVRLDKSLYPEVNLDVTPTCGACGGGMDDKGQLVCSDCGKDVHHCVSCGGAIGEDDYRTDENGETWCQSCHDEAFCCCEICENYCRADDVQSANNQSVCDSCLSDHFTKCNGCDEYFMDPDSRRRRRGNGGGCCTEACDGEMYCDNCRSEDFSSCRKCEEEFANDDLNSDGICAECVKNKEEEDKAREAEEAEEAEETITIRPGE